MSEVLYRLNCLTNLHMGSGDTNYDIIDLEVERDPVLGEPTMNASGVKGALRDYCEKQAGAQGERDIITIFGGKGEGDRETSQGSYRFFAGDLLARPVRVSQGDVSYLLATTPDLLRHVLNKLHAFNLQMEFKDIPRLQNGKCLSPSGVKRVEGIDVVSGDCPALTKLLGTKEWVLMSPADLANIDLPVMAHNVLQDGISQNLWYEQVVPHESVFLLVVGSDDGNRLLEKYLKNNAVVQFGAGATTGEGYTQMQKVEGKV